MEKIIIYHGIEKGWPNVERILGYYHYLKCMVC